jgi:nucleotide-binding universal stress UspA family protein
MNAIVVGVDGSEAASKALEWAIAEARLRMAPLRIVSAWHVPMEAYGAPGFAPAVSPPLRQSISEEAESVAEGAVRRAKDAGLEQVEHPRPRGPGGRHSD